MTTDLKWALSSALSPPWLPCCFLLLWENYFASSRSSLSENLKLPFPFQTLSWPCFSYQEISRPKWYLFPSPTLSYPFACVYTCFDCSLLPQGWGRDSVVGMTDHRLLAWAGGEVNGSIFVMYTHSPGEEDIQPCRATWGLHLGTDWTSRGCGRRLCSYHEGEVPSGSFRRMWLACLSSWAGWQGTNTCCLGISRHHAWSLDKEGHLARLCLWEQKERGECVVKPFEVFSILPNVETTLNIEP